MITSGIIIDGLKDAIADGVKQAAFEVLKSLATFLVDTSYSVALIGSGICIGLYVAGFTKAAKYPGALILGFVLIRYILGGVVK